MKKKIFFMAAMALCIAACSNNTTPSGEETKALMSFKANIDGRVSSRASGTAWNAGDKIGITSSDGQYSNSVFTTTSGNGIFSGEAGYYSSSTAVTFSAYYPYQSTGGIASVAITSSTSQPTIDFMYATASGSAASPTVNFSFSHKMSQLNLNFIAGTGVSSLSGMAATITGVPTTGTFNTGSGVATSTDTGSLSMSGTSSFIVFPGSLSGTLTVTLGSGTFNATIPKTTLEAGKSYTVNITVNKTAVNISTATISGWGTGSTQNVTASM